MGPGPKKIVRKCRFAAVLLQLAVAPRISRIRMATRAEASVSPLGSWPLAFALGPWRYHSTMSIYFAGLGVVYLGSKMQNYLKRSEDAPKMPTPSGPVPKFCPMT